MQLFAKFKKILLSGFRTTLTIRKFKVAPIKRSFEYALLGAWEGLVTLTHLHFNLLISSYILQDRACPQLAKANLGGPCLDSRVTKIYLKKEIY